jgi:hypothetical protein
LENLKVINTQAIATIFTATASLVFFNCSTNLPPKQFRGGRYGSRDAGKEVTIIYQSPEDIVKIGNSKGNERDVEKSLLSPGGRLIIGTKKETFGGYPNGTEIDISNQRQNVEYVNINIDGHYYCECVPLFPEESDGNILYQSCEVGKQIKSNFEVLLLNHEKTPFGKYSVRMDY